MYKEFIECSGYNSDSLLIPFKRNISNDFVVCGYGVRYSCIFKLYYFI